MSNVARGIQFSVSLHAILIAGSIVFFGGALAPQRGISIEFSIEQDAPLSTVAQAPRQSAMKAPAPPAKPDMPRPPEPTPAEPVSAETLEPEVAPMESAGKESESDYASATTEQSALSAANVGPATSVQSAGAIMPDLSGIKELVQNKLTYPSVARQRGWEGRVVVSFTIDRSGRVRDAEIVESSGRDLLDRNVLAVLENIDLFPRRQSDVKAVIPVVYRLTEH